MSRTLRTVAAAVVRAHAPGSAAQKFLDALKDRYAVHADILARDESFQPAQIRTRPTFGVTPEHNGHRYGRVIGHCWEATS